ncbi:PLC-like phosphodiesterases superfamily protein [Tanacetum coccineum]|uniref:PLC-like phosphodiesterases superfamily protein n=1 Tax=Tanacetum coccineum TaxID=301880 RepID=A0ABQ5JBR7_9ASTR
MGAQWSKQAGRRKQVANEKKILEELEQSCLIDVIINDIKKFISETVSEIIILEIRTEVGHNDPPEFEKYLEEQLGEYLIHQDDNLFHKTIAQVLPKRIICLWKPGRSSGPPRGSPFWNANYLYGDWINTDLPATKFESNLRHLRQQLPVSYRRYFYRVGNTVTPWADNPVLCVKPVTNGIRRYARLFLRQCVLLDIVDLLQIFSTDFIDEDFVDACIGLTWARVEGKL